MIFKCPSTKPGGSVAMPATTEKMQTATRHLRNADMTATNWILSLERLDAQSCYAFIWSRGRIALATRRGALLALPNCSPRRIRPAAEKPVPHKNGRDRSLYPAQKLNATSYGSVSSQALRPCVAAKSFRALGTIVRPATSTMGSPVPAVIHEGELLARTRTPQSFET